MARQIKIGIFGASRGKAYIDLISEEDPGEIRIVAVCDRQENKLQNAKAPDGAELFDDFDSFIKYGKSVGMNAVFLCNFFHQHAEYAIKAMESGMDVVSECTSAATMKSCVDLVRCVERTGRKYMLAENYPFMTPNLEMKRIIDGGSLGTLLYAEGEYNHSGDRETLRSLTPTPYHWRAWMPRTYYLTHAMGPLMYMTGSMPKYVSARAAHSKLLEQFADFRHNDDGMARIFCEMSNGMTASFTGCTAQASDYSRYRVVGDKGSVEQGGHTGGRVRLLYGEHTVPDGVGEKETYIEPDAAAWGEETARAQRAGHGGSDYLVVRNLIDYFSGGAAPFFDVYKGVAMSATAILAWRSCLAHGENFAVPDFTKEEDRKRYEDDDLTPFPDENGNGASLPPSTTYGKY